MACLYCNNKITNNISQGLERGAYVSFDNSCYSFFSFFWHYNLKDLSQYFIYKYIIKSYIRLWKAVLINATYYQWSISLTWRYVICDVRFLYWQKLNIIGNQFEHSLHKCWSCMCIYMFRHIYFWSTQQRYSALSLYISDLRLYILYHIFA
jgi:hypothetical protein